MNKLKCTRSCLVHFNGIAIKIFIFYNQNMVKQANYTNIAWWTAHISG
ncbi:MAG: hypothetical protein US04_C0001G0192 [Candidatus Nomurabacteria bacterium GW2011_GWD2_36_14]|nr:MAG: hypothetical protein UR97_C0004G0051 [Candidatus Nomurabacteria bacterium GW2011_GWE2_36_115]KKP94182.1 MAG: hypothetical protein US00_C0003G0106 [Candidatus Nomurabacteria bacterium GW2011_GWF2_36_126]KKP96690.1 MAG: hypothetical protein US04_C0001G0192 [Candidatus Nomurabacteria bacterium GW2011_GWD2_36_14]KKP99706.1 MAG: hypothetical protein US08_C0001G0389 [Candidatus Nomurabacteria bacterium GW2011_GWF2_36_19]KKQ05348.1 MAG: hypothetical protein US17_C0005G0115 [Candidatus Nomuraba